MQIQDLKSFLQACQNICVIKRKTQTSDQVEKNLKFDDAEVNNKPQAKEETKGKEEVKEEIKVEELSTKRSKRIKKNVQLEDQKEEPKPIEKQE